MVQFGSANLERRAKYICSAGAAGRVAPGRVADERSGVGSVPPSPHQLDNDG